VTGPNEKLTLADIADIRAYEREREAFRAHVIALKKRRRVSVGPVVTLVFENRDTVRFQIQEMARAERIFSDEGIQTELDIYNPLIPEPGTLRATLFIEVTAEHQMRSWLPKLVGVERAVELRLPGGAVVRARPDAEHAEQLTREETTASVHYLGWELSEAEVAAVVGGGPVSLCVAHPNYAYCTDLDEAVVSELRRDLQGA
jgi:hypothetical protein